MVTNNALNITATGIVKYDGAGAFTATTTTNHNLLVGSTSNAITNVAPSATSGVPVISQGASADPTFGTAVVAGGGTGQVTLTNHGVLVGAGTSAITQLAAGSAGQVLQSGGASADPAYSTATFPSTATSTGTILRADGTNWAATTATYPATTTINQVLYSSSNNVVGGITAANNGTMISGTTGVPSWLANGTTGQILTATTGSPPSWVAPATSGTVTSVSGTANQVSVANGTTTPVISLIGPYTPATYTAHGVLVGEGTSSITALAAGSAGQVLQSGGASADPTYSTATYPATATGTGTILRADGTNWAATTATYPNTVTTGDILYASGTNVIGSLSDVATGQVLTSGGVGAVPAYSATPTVTSITFGSGAALSIFEQGTFNPTIRGSSTAGTVSMSTQVGRYQKVGRMVSVIMTATWTTIGTATGAVQCNNLPYTCVNVSGVGSISLCIGSASALTTGSGGVPFMQTNINATTANVNYYLGSDGANRATTITASNGFQTVFNYETA